MPTARRTVITILLVATAATSLAFATGAAVVGDADTFADDRIAVQPAEGPGGKYAYLDDGEITIDISASNDKLPNDFRGVNPDTLASADGVFTITYTANESARVWIEHESENVTFVADGKPIEGEVNNITLGPNESVAVGLRIDARGEVAGTTVGGDNFSIAAEVVDPPTASTSGGGGSNGDPPSTSVMSPAMNERQFVGEDLDFGEPVTFDAGGMYPNGGNVTMDRLELTDAPSGRIELNAVGSPEAPDEERTLDTPTDPQALGYSSLTYDFEPEEVEGMMIQFSADATYLEQADVDPDDVVLYRQTDAGEWEQKPTEVIDDETVRDRGLDTDRIHFRVTADDFSTFVVAAEVSHVEVTDASIEATAVEPNGTASVRATVRNRGGVNGTRTIALTADGEPIATRAVALAPNESTTVELSGRVAGDVALAVDGVPAGTIDSDGTDADPTAEPTPLPDEPDDTPAAPAAVDADEQVLEPGGIDPGDLGGLALLLALVVAIVALVRRMPRS